MANANGPTLVDLQEVINEEAAAAGVPPMANSPPSSATDVLGWPPALRTVKVRAWLTVQLVARRTTCVTPSDEAATTGTPLVAKVVKLVVTLGPFKSCETGSSAVMVVEAESSGSSELSTTGAPAHPSLTDI
jgi:hypothetical protein